MSATAGRAAIRTHAGVVDARRSRTPQGALLEMASLEMERQRLLAESVRLQRRSEQIAIRVVEIIRRQQRLHRFVDLGEPAGEPLSQTAAPPVSPSPMRTAPLPRSRKLGY